MDYFKYMVLLAEEYVTKSNLRSLIFKDSKLFWLIFTELFIPHQYSSAQTNEKMLHISYLHINKAESFFNTNRLKKLLI